MEVQANYGNKGKWVPATIIREALDGLHYEVEYEGGQVEENVPRSCIAVRGTNPNPNPNPNPNATPKPNSNPNSKFASIEEEEDEPAPPVFRDWEERDPILHDIDNDLVDAQRVEHELYPRRKNPVDLKYQPDVKVGRVKPRGSTSASSGSKVAPRNSDTKIHRSSSARLNKTTPMPVPRSAGNQEFSHAEVKHMTERIKKLPLHNAEASSHLGRRDPNSASTVVRAPKQSNIASW